MKKNLLVLGMVLVACTGYGMGHIPVFHPITQPNGTLRQAQDERGDEWPAKKNPTRLKKLFSKKKLVLQKKIWCRKLSEEMLKKARNPERFTGQYHALCRLLNESERAQLWSSLNALMEPDSRDLSVTQHIEKESRLETYVRLCLSEEMREQK